MSQASSSRACESECFLHMLKMHMYDDQSLLREVRTIRAVRQCLVTLLRNGLPGVCMSSHRPVTYRSTPRNAHMQAVRVARGVMACFPMPSSHPTKCTHHPRLDVPLLRQFDTVRRSWGFFLGGGGHYLPMIICVRPGHCLVFMLTTAHHGPASCRDGKSIPQ